MTEINMESVQDIQYTELGRRGELKFIHASRYEVVITLHSADAELLYERIEQGKWDEAHHSVNLQRHIDELMDRVDELEEFIENIGM